MHRIQVRDFNPDIGMDRLQAFHKLKLSQRDLERHSLPACGLPRRATLKTKRVKQLAQRLKFPGTGRMANCSNAFDHGFTQWPQEARAKKNLASRVLLPSPGP